MVHIRCERINVREHPSFHFVEVLEIGIVVPFVAYEFHYFSEAKRKTQGACSVLCRFGCVCKLALFLREASFERSRPGPALMRVPVGAVGICIPLSPGGISRRLPRP